MESIKNHSVYFLLICIAIFAFLFYSIISPFFGPLIVAAVFAFLFRPLNKKMNKYFKNKKNLATLVTTVIAVIIILIPISFVGTQIVKESTFVYNYVADGGFDNFMSKTNNLLSQSKISKNLDIDFKQYVEKILQNLIQNVGSIFSSFTKILLNFFVFIMAFYFFLKDGEKLKDYFVVISPLDDKDDKKILDRLKMAVSAIVKGSLLIGLIQGTLTGVGFAIFGVPNAVLWGTVAAISALIPGIGTALVIVPGIAFLFITGNTFGGFGMLIWGTMAVGLIDNLLSPRLVGKGMKVHPLLIFLAVLGGLTFYGPLGFLLGPLTVSVFLALVEIYFSLKSK